MSVMTETRRDQIAAELTSRRFMSIGDITARFGCSVATARRDLDALARAGRIRRSRGGALAVTEAARGTPLMAAGEGPAEIDPFAAVKRRIACVASGLIADGDTVGLGGGTTTLEVARCLRVRTLGIVTNAVDHALELASVPGAKVVLIGGMLTSGHELVGLLAECMLAQIRIDTLFISVNGLSVEAGATIIDDLEAQLLRAMAARARRLVVVADHRKLGRTAVTQVVPIEAVRMLVTDAAPSPIREAIERAGVQVVEV